MSDTEHAILMRLAEGDSLIAFSACGVQWESSFGGAIEHPDFDALLRLMDRGLVEGHGDLFYSVRLTECGQLAALS